MTTPLLSLSEIAEGVASQAALHNTALREFEARTVRVLSKSTTVPPGSPAESNAYIIPVGSPSSWGGSSNQIATYIGGAWSYYTPIEGVTVWVNDLDALYTYNGTAWVLSVIIGSSSPLTTKGDVYTFSTVDARLAVGTNDQVLTADSAQATGIKWAAASAGNVKWGGVATNSGNDYTISTTPATTTLPDGISFLWRVNVTNTVGNARLTVTGTAIKSIVKEGAVSLAAGDLVADTIVMVTYSTAYDVYHLLRTSSEVRLTGAQTVAGAKTFSSPIIIPDGIAATDGVAIRQVPFNNVLINAGFRQVQRGTSFAAVATGAYTLDRWLYSKVGTMVHTITQDTDVPTVAQAGMLIPFSYRLNLTTADTTIAAGDNAFVSQRIEGYNFQHLAQRAFTVSFWAKATTAGIYGIALRNSGSDRSYISNFTLNASNVWEQMKISVLASPSAGTWNYTNGIGLDVSIVLATGTTFHTTAGAWQTGNFLGTASNINGVNTGATDFRFAAITILPGSATGALFEMRDIKNEIEQCRRYRQQSFQQGITPAQSLGVNTGEYTFPAMRAAALVNKSSTIPFSTTMRATPASIVLFNPAAANAQVRDLDVPGDCSSSTVNASSENGFEIITTGNASTAAGNLLAVHWTADSEL